MTLFELVNALGGEIVCNEARVRRDGKWITLCKIVGNDWQLTQVGERLLDSVATPPPPVEPIEVVPAAPVARRGRPRKPAVEVTTDGDD